MKRLIGYGYTNNKGIATLDYDKNGQAINPSGYEGNSRGLVDIQAVWHEDETIETEQIEITDCIIFDKGDTDTDTDNWTKTDCTMTITSNGLECTASRNWGHVAPVNHNFLNKLPLILEMTVVSHNSVPRFYFSPSNFYTFNGAGLYRFEINTDGVIIKKNGVQVGTASAPATSLELSISFPYATGTLTFKDYKLYYKRTTSPIVLNLVSSRNPVTLGETYNLKAFVKGSDGVGSFYPVDFYRGNTKFKTVVTDRSGCATVNGLVGTGKGLINYKASYNNSLQSETYELYDCIFYDKIGNSENWYFIPQYIQRTISNNDVKLECISSGQASYNLNKEGTSKQDVYDWDLPTFCIEMNVLETNGFYFQIYDKTNLFTGSRLSAIGHYKIVYDGTTVKLYIDGNLKPSFTKTFTYDSLYVIRFILNPNDIVRFNEFKLYPI